MAKYLTNGWRKNISNSLKTHGKSKYKIYMKWALMKQRCNNPKYSNYKYYGGRGVKVCERWLKFDNFYSDMGDIPEGKTLERIDNNGDYEFKNCRWATNQEQQNNKSSNVFISYRGEMKTITQWANKIGVKPITLFRRYYCWKDINRMFEQPFRKSPAKKRASLRVAY